MVVISIGKDEQDVGKIKTLLEKLKEGQPKTWLSYITKDANATIGILGMAVHTSK